MQQRPRLLVLSHVLPYPPTSGQVQRVSNSLLAARKRFHTTLVTYAPARKVQELSQTLQSYCDKIVVLPSIYLESRSLRMAESLLYQLATGLKHSNYVIGQVEFAPNRLARDLSLDSYDCVLFEYWHAAASTRLFQERRIPCVLDMHDIIWWAEASRLAERGLISRLTHPFGVSRYRMREERAWNNFDAIFAINNEESRYVQERLPDKRIIYMPMGIDTGLWPYLWQPSDPVRVAYFGGLGSAHNQRSALECHSEIMPVIWRKYPEAELWLIGSNPPERIKALESDRRVRVTGFLEDVRSTLASATLVLCPWRGTFGFRSRIIEIMSLGVPVVASREAVYGMDLVEGEGIMLGTSSEEMAAHALKLLSDREFALCQSRLGRAQVERNFSFANTYERGFTQLCDWLLEWDIRC